MSLPDTIRSVELGFVDFFPGEGCWRECLEKLREELDWSLRNPASRPSVRIIMERMERPMVGKAIWLEEEISAFLYNSGEYPMDGIDSTRPKFGFGTMRDLFDPEFTRLFDYSRRLREIGIETRKDDSMDISY